MLDVEFVDLVNRDIRDEVEQEESDFLRDPENRDLWLQTLKTFKRNSETQLAERRSDKASKAYKRAVGELSDKEWSKYLAEYESWRCKAIRFKNGVEQRISDVKAMSRTEENSLLLRYNDLVDAIRQHSESGDEEIELADAKLYSKIGLQ